MRRRSLFIIVFALIMMFSFSGCLDSGKESGETTATGGEEERIETMYDESGNLSREDHYDSDGELMYYLTYEYDENNLLTLKNEFDENGVKTSYTEYEYHENGKTSSENIVWLDEQGELYERNLIEYYESGNRNKLFCYNSADELFSTQIFSESGACLLSDTCEYDENGVFTGRRVVEHTEEMLFIREELYDSSNELITRSTYSYHDNGEMNESKQVNGKGEIINHTVCDENGQETYREINFFYDNGTMSENSKTEYKDGISYSSIYKYDENGSLISREITEATKAGVIKSEIYGSEGEIIYYKDSQRMEQALFTENGEYQGRNIVEYFGDGSTKLEKEFDSKERLTMFREYSEKGVILINESRKYNSAGIVIEYSYEQISEDDVILKNERVKYDDNGNVVDKDIAIYDKLGNVTYDERIEGGELKYKYTAEYYGKEKIKKEESYRNDGVSIMIRSVEYDEKDRLIYRYDSHEMLNDGLKNETLYKCRYNSADVIVYREQKGAGMMGHVIEEFYDSGKIKKYEETKRDGREYMLEEYSESGEVVRYHQVIYNDDGQKLVENKREIIDGNMITSRDEYRYNDAGVLVVYDHSGSDGAVLKEYYDNGNLCFYKAFSDEGRNKPLIDERYYEDGTLYSRYEYDGDGRVIYSYTLKDEGAETYIYRYNEKGDMIYVERINSNERWIVEYYDNMQVKKSETYSANGQLLDYSEFYENGQMKKILYYDEDGNLINHGEWDENGNPIV